MAGLVSIHHILWYALAIRQHSDFGITAAGVENGPAPKAGNRVSAQIGLYSNIAGRMDMASSANNPRAALADIADILASLLTTAPASDFHPWENHCLGAAIPLLRLGEYERALQCLAGLQKPTTGCPTVPLPRSAHTRRLAAGH
ncbi:MAG: hypothetical protein QOJ15_8249 [Bradyrhizobium sp.]|nr:hypothetical protein [Bradyrhizobium sp.]